MKKKTEASLVAQWERIHLPLQETWVWSLIWEDPTYLEQLSLCTTNTEPVSQSLGALTTEACGPWSPQQEKSLQWEAQAPQLESGPRSLQLEKASAQQWRPNAAKNAFNLKKF